MAPRVQEEGAPQLRSGEGAILLAHEHSTQSTFFGKYVEVPLPPLRLLNILERSRALDLKFEPVFLPRIEFREDSDYPGWIVRPEGFFWRAIQAGKVQPDAARLPGVWALFDATHMPRSGERVYADDPLADLISSLRVRGVVRRSKNVPDGARVLISMAELQASVFPALASLLKIRPDDAIIRVPTLMEYSFLGNLRYPFLGDHLVREWLHDKVEEFDRLIAGFRLSAVDLYLSTTRHMSLGFRPIIFAS